MADIAMDDDALGPVSRLFVDSLPGEPALQMCFMRPEPDELCPELPFLVPPPTLRSLRDCGLEPTVVSAADVLAVGPPAASDMSTSAQPEPLSADERKALLCTAVQAAARGTAVPATLSRLRPADWEAALDAKFGETLNAAALRNLAGAAGSEALCDHLLRYAVPRLLKEHAAKTPDADGAPSLAADRESGAEALPPALSALLTSLLQGGSLLRLPDADEFDERCTRLLRTSVEADPSRLGLRAATQAACMYAARRA